MSGNQAVHEFGPSFPQWTEFVQVKGLDPLGMQRPIELVYQSLLPGISTITLRLRYYSFFPWLLEAYARHNGSSNIEDFRAFIRRGEALLVLACTRGGEKDGVAGSDWATRELRELGDNPESAQIIEFSHGVDPNSSPGNQYLQKGAFVGIYATQLQAMKLIRLDDPQFPVPYCSNSAIPLAKAMQNEMGNLADVFLAAVKSGRITVGELDQLALLKPSRIRLESAEQKALVAALTGRHADAGNSDVQRRQTLLELLMLARTHKRVPQVDDAKWEWFAPRDQEDIDRQTSVLLEWSLYQASDLMRLAYEGLLSACLRVLSNAPFSRQALSILVEEVVKATKFDGRKSFSESLDSLVADASPEALARQAQDELMESENTGESADEILAALKLIAALWRKRHDYPPEIMELLGANDYFQSYATELEFLEGLMGSPSDAALSEIVKDRVIKRHLWVASQKFRNQKAYTFLLEPDGGKLRYRTGFKVSASSPRIKQAVQFLQDAKLLDDDGPTELGLSEIARQ